MDRNQFLRLCGIAFDINQEDAKKSIQWVDNALTHTCGYAHDTLTPQEIREGRLKGKIPCIKMHRNRTGVGLKESKDICENWFYNILDITFGPPKYT